LIASWSLVVSLVSVNANANAGISVISPLSSLASTEATEPHKPEGVNDFSI